MGLILVGDSLGDSSMSKAMKSLPPIEKSILYRLIGCFALAALALTTSCSKTLPGAAVIEPASASTSGSPLIYGKGIKSVNGKKVRSSNKQDIPIKPGVNVIVLDPLPKGKRSTLVELRFNAKPGSRYQAVSRAMQRGGNCSPLDYQGSRLASDIIEAYPGGGGMMDPIGGVVVTAALGVGMAEPVARILTRDLPAALPTATDLDIMIISDDPREGVVARVLVYQDGEIEVKE